MVQHKKIMKRNFLLSLALISLAAWLGVALRELPAAFAQEWVTVAKKSAPSIRNTVPTSVVTAYYFHGSYRCYTCKKIEQYSREAIEKYYASELKDKKLEFRPVNVDEKGNRHFIQDYQLYTRSLVIVLYQKDRQIRWKNLPDVWTYVRDREKFYQYVKAELDAMLREAK